MRSRLFWRRSAAAAGIYASVVLGFFGTVIAAHAFTTRVLGLYAIVIAATGFFQTLLDLTIEEALVKYGFRFQERDDWGRLRRLFSRALQLKLAGGVLAGVCLLALAPAAHALFGDDRLLKPMLIASVLPLAPAPENVGGVALILRGRYDIRAFFLLLSMALRLGARAAGFADGADPGRGTRHARGRVRRRSSLLARRRCRSPARRTAVAVACPGPRPPALHLQERRRDGRAAADRRRGRAAVRLRLDEKLSGLDRASEAAHLGTRNRDARPHSAG